MNATLGPWHTSKCYTGRAHGADGCDIGAENGSNIALVHHQTGDRSEAETVANAKLIAAAPDLFDALKAIDNLYVNAWDLTDGGLHFSAESVAKFERAHKAARAAIARATT